jgi:hypothetical protein
VIDAFVDRLDLSRLGFDGVAPEVRGRPSYHPSVLLKLLPRPKTTIIYRIKSAAELQKANSSEILSNGRAARAH